MGINIDNFSEKELIDLNHKIVERLNFNAQMKHHSKMMEFSIGEKISFIPIGNEIRFGVITKYNTKTISVMTDDGMRWNVSPNLLNKIKDAKAKVIQLNRKNKKNS
jgi:hypothetical protein